MDKNLSQSQASLKKKAQEMGGGCENRGEHPYSGNESLMIQ